MDLRTIMRNSLHFGIGAISMTREKVDELVSELVKKGEMTKGEGKRLADEVTGVIDRAKKEIDTHIHNGTRKAAEALNLVTMDELKKLDRKINRLRADLRKLSAESPAKGKKKKGA
jgi:polyhydroxyalkanoate synthesis regulator phasin